MIHTLCSKKKRSHRNKSPRQVFPSCLSSCPNTWPPLALKTAAERQLGKAAGKTLPAPLLQAMHQVKQLSLRTSLLKAEHVRALRQDRCQRCRAPLRTAMALGSTTLTKPSKKGAEVETALSSLLSFSQAVFLQLPPLSSVLAL